MEAPGGGACFPRPAAKSAEAKRGKMIKVTRLNGRPFVINAELIQFIEETPDTVITMTTHEKVLVKESADEVIRRVVEFGRSLRVFPDV